MHAHRTYLPLSSFLCLHKFEKIYFLLKRKITMRVIKEENGNTEKFQNRPIENISLVQKVSEFLDIYTSHCPSGPYWVGILGQASIPSKIASLWQLISTFHSKTAVEISTTYPIPPVRCGSIWQWSKNAYFVSNLSWCKLMEILFSYPRVLYYWNNAR